MHRSEIAPGSTRLSRSRKQAEFEPPHDPALDLVLGDFQLTEVVSHLLRRAHFRAEEIFSGRAGQLGLTPRQKALLITAYQNPGANQSLLADRIAIDRNSFAEMLARMLKAGFLERRRAPQDARSNQIFITGKGIEAVKRIMPVDRLVEAEVIGPLPPEYRPLFIKCLRMMVGIDGESPPGPCDTHTS